jgi:hypothetical protein
MKPIFIRTQDIGYAGKGRPNRYQSRENFVKALIDGCTARRYCTVSFRAAFAAFSNLCCAFPASSPTAVAAVSTPDITPSLPLRNADSNLPRDQDAQAGTTTATPMAANPQPTPINPNPIRPAFELVFILPPYL